MWLVESPKGTEDLQIGRDRDLELSPHESEGFMDDVLKWLLV